jgi:hypothetical protein
VRFLGTFDTHVFAGWRRRFRRRCSGCAALVAAGGFACVRIYQCLNTNEDCRTCIQRVAIYSSRGVFGDRFPRECYTPFITLTIELPVTPSRTPTVQRFWQDESFDHYPRGSHQLELTAGYIEGNPVSAGLVCSAEQWPWSSAGWQAKPPGETECPTKHRHSEYR